MHVMVTLMPPMLSSSRSNDWGVHILEEFQQAATA
jgi:hypothetical protein